MEHEQSPRAERPAEAPASRSGGGTARRVVWIVVAVILAFALGAGWQYLQAREASSELEETQRTLALLRLESTLASAAIDAQLGNYELARRRASGFFTDLQQSIAQLPADGRGAFQQLLGQRDATITMLSRGDPQSASVLTRAYVELRGALERAIPRPAATGTDSAP